MPSEGCRNASTYCVVGHVVEPGDRSRRLWPSGRDGACLGSSCDTGTCDPGETRECYTGSEDTIGVGPCATGEQKCTAAGQWGSCDGRGDSGGRELHRHVDNNCNGAVDDDVDLDGDGFTSCGGDCCDSTECGTPGLANPGAFDAPGNGVDDDCNGRIDDTTLLCDQGLMSNLERRKDFAKAIDICQEASCPTRSGASSAHR